MDEVKVDIIDGPFSGFEAVLLSQCGNQVQVLVSIFDRQTPVDLYCDQVRIAGTTTILTSADVVADPHAALRKKIAGDHDSFAEAEAFTFFLDRLDTPESDPATEWDAYLVYRDEARTRAETRKQAALERFERELSDLPADEARQAVDANAEYWLPGRTAAAEQQKQFPEPPSPEECMLRSIFGELDEGADVNEEAEASPPQRARERLDRARLAVEDRDYERWEANRSEQERQAGPSRGNPSRYAWARTTRLDVSLPVERNVELAVRSETGVTEGPIPTPHPLADEPAATLIADLHAANDDGSRADELEHKRLAWRRADQLKRAMLAGRRLDLAQAIVVDESGPLWHDMPTTVAGLLLPDGIGDVPFPDNPWDIPANAGLAAALTQVWAPITDLAPQFVAAVHDHTLALALLTGDDGSTALGYFTWHRDDELVPPPEHLDQFADPAIDYYLSIVVGAAPHLTDPTAVVPVLAGPVPRPIRGFWTIHHFLGQQPYDHSIGGALDINTLEFFNDDSWSVAAERLGGLPPDRFVHSVGYDDFVTYVLDLDVLDSSGNPTVVAWDWKAWEVGGHKQFWDWLDSDGAELIFGR